MIYLWLSRLFMPLLSVVAGRAPQRPRRLLVIQMAKIGDFLCSTPVLRELRRTFPEAQIDVLANPANRSLVRGNPNVSSMIEADAARFSGICGKVRLIRLLRQGHYDTVICLNAGAAYAIGTLWAGIPRRLAVMSNFGGSSHRVAKKLWTGIEPHRGDRLIQQTYLALLEQLGVRGGTLDKDAFVLPDAVARVQRFLGDGKDPLIGIGVSSANRLKALGSDKIVAVGLRLLEAIPGAHLVLVGGPDDKLQAEEIVSCLPAQRVIDSCGSCSLAELPALLKRLTVFVGVDSGVTYMADAAGVPLVSVAGPCNMAETRPLGPRVTILQRKDLPCAPCAHIFRAPYTCHTGTRACILEISAADIAEAVLRLIELKGKA